MVGLDEQEVLYERKFQFVVISKVFYDEIWYILLEEVWFMYEDNDKDLTEERIRMIKANIPEFKIVGEVKLTEEKKKEGKETLLRFIKEREYFIKERERK